MVTEEGQRLDEGSRGGGRGDDKGKFDWKKKGWKPPLPNQRDSDLRELSRERAGNQYLLCLIGFLFSTYTTARAKYHGFHFSFPCFFVEILHGSVQLSEMLLHEK